MLKIYAIGMTGIAVVLAVATIFAVFANRTNASTITIQSQTIDIQKQTIQSLESALAMEKQNRQSTTEELIRAKQDLKITKVVGQVGNIVGTAPDDAGSRDYNHVYVRIQQALLDPDSLVRTEFNEDGSGTAWLYLSHPPFECWKKAACEYEAVFDSTGRVTQFDVVSAPTPNNGILQ